MADRTGADVATVEEFARRFAAALQERDEVACAALWGEGAIVLADRFETVAQTPAGLEPFLRQAWPIYDVLDVGRIEHRVIETVDLTAAMVRILVRYSFVDRSGEHLTDGDFEYVLRRDGDALRCHIGVNISAESRLSDLARARGHVPGT